MYFMAGVGKCPNGTSPKYWGHDLQQIVENDVPNPQNVTFTKPCMKCAVWYIQIYVYKCMH